MIKAHQSTWWVTLALVYSPRPPARKVVLVGEEQPLLSLPHPIPTSKTTVAHRRQEVSPGESMPNDRPTHIHKKIMLSLVNCGPLLSMFTPHSKGTNCKPQTPVLVLGCIFQKISFHPSLLYSCLLLLMLMLLLLLLLLMLLSSWSSSSSSFHSINYLATVYLSLPYFSHTRLPIKKKKNKEGLSRAAKHKQSRLNYTDNLLWNCINVKLPASEWYIYKCTYIHIHKRL